MDRHPQILNASTNLLGICLGLITGLRLTNFGETSVGDEVAWAAALMFLLSPLNSFVVIRNNGGHDWQGVWADRIFLVGVCLLILATVLVGFAVR